MAISISAPVTWWSFLKKGCLATRSLVVLLLVSVPTGSAGAADWSLKALFSETALYDDNRSLSAISPGDTYGLLSALTLDLAAKTADVPVRLHHQPQLPLSTSAPVPPD